MVDLYRIKVSINPVTNRTSFLQRSEYNGAYMGSIIALSKIMSTTLDRNCSSSWTCRAMNSAHNSAKVDGVILFRSARVLFVRSFIIEIRYAISIGLGWE